EAGQDMREGVVQSEPDDVARLPVIGDRQAEVAACALQRSDDRGRRVHQGAVPVEYDEIEPARFHCGRLAVKDSSDAGNGASSTRLSPVRGCAITVFAECRNMRFSPWRASVLLSAKSPYFSSPTIGNPRWARCTRI